MSSDLIEFLLERITEDEVTTHRADVATNVDPWEIHVDRTYDAAMLVVDRRRVIAECKARRAMVGAASKAIHDFELVRRVRLSSDPVDRAKVLAGSDARRSAWIQGLRLLALGYADHPDFREEWRTTTDIRLWPTAGDGEIS